MLSKKPFAVVNDKSLEILKKLLKKEYYDCFSYTFTKSGLIFMVQTQLSKRDFHTSMRVFIHDRNIEKYEEKLTNLLHECNHTPEVSV